MGGFIRANGYLQQEFETEITLSAVSIAGGLAQVDFRSELSKTKRDISTVRLLESNLDEAQSYHTVTFSDDSKMTNLRSKFGKMISVTVEKISADGRTEIITDEVYNPELVEIINRDELLTISPNEDITIRWERDEVNDKPITISLIGRSYGVNGDQLIDVDFTKLVSDTGSFTIQRSELDIFDPSTTIDIVVARANQTVINDNTLVTMYNSDLVASRIAIE